MYEKITTKVEIAPLEKYGTVQTDLNTGYVPTGVDGPGYNAVTYPPTAEDFGFVLTSRALP
jgi:hypothetical protein